MTGAVLELSGVTKRFGGLTAVDRLDIDLQEGEIRGLIGPNGAGKSTVINLISGVLRPDEGRLRLLGGDVTRRPPHEIARLGLRRTFQNLRLFPELTVLENTLIGLQANAKVRLGDVIVGTRRFRVSEEQMREIALRHLADAGLAEKAETPAGELTYGQQKLLEIARALAGSPRVLMLDEPIAGLSVEEAQRVIALVREQRERGVTVLIVEHNVPVVMGLADRVTVLDFGRKLAEDVPIAIQRHPAVIQAYLGDQGMVG